ncbi:MAG TPA: sigma-70 family RNA polymerase sigma factor [Candidatus Kapabacteria bacterium]|nr:sigma-70 family RNA polymerase sigma factor [Candidatus Kapabacteria bacterium]
MFSHHELVREMPNLRRFAIKLTRNNCDADDLLQSTMLKSLESRRSFDRGSNLFGWTSRIMYNAFVSHYRRSVRFDSLYDPQHYIDQETVEPDQEITLELESVLGAMARLSEDHREILSRVCLEGRRYAEVSELLQLPVGTVRSRLSRAREALVLALGQDPEADARHAC